MNVNLTTKIVTRSGEPFKAGDKEMTVRDAIWAAIDAPLQGDENLSGKEKRKLTKIGDLISEVDSIELNSVEIAALDARAARALIIPVYGQLARALDPALFKDD